jgi:hypothetical protein
MDLLRSLYLTVYVSVWSCLGPLRNCLGLLWSFLGLLCNCSGPLLSFVGLFGEIWMLVISYLKVPLFSAVKAGADCFVGNGNPVLLLRKKLGSYLADEKAGIKLAPLHGQPRLQRP